MGTKQYVSNYKSSVTLQEGNTRFFAYMEELSLEYVVLRGLEEREYKELFLSMYPYYYNAKRQTRTQCFRNVLISDPVYIRPGTYKFSFSSLSEEEQRFLQEYSAQWVVEEKIHKSNQLKLDFELALNLINPRMEKLADSFNIQSIFHSMKEKMQLQNTIFNYLTPTRVYYGSEFCPRLLPSLQKVDHVLHKMEKERLDITFVTPTLYQEDMKKFEEIINHLHRYAEENKKEIEVVFNNWGTFEILRDRKYITPVIGRLLAKYKRDPRFSYENNELFAPYNTELRSGDLSVDLYRNFLTQSGICRAEVDCLPQGVPKDLSREDIIGLHLHFPFYIASTSRMCLLGALNRDFATVLDFKQPCKLECRKYYYDVAFWDKLQLDADPEAKNVQSIVRGRGLFSIFANWKERFDFEEAYKKNIKRLIFYHEVPY